MRQGLIALFVAMGITTAATAEDFDTMPRRRVAGYSVIAAGGVLTFVGIFAGAAGKSPCAGETDEVERRECFEREKRSAHRGNEMRAGIVGVGLAAIASGIWLID